MTKQVRWQACYQAFALLYLTMYFGCISQTYVPIQSSLTRSDCPYLSKSFRTTFFFSVLTVSIQPHVFRGQQAPQGFGVDSRLSQLRNRPCYFGHYCWGQVGCQMFHRIKYLSLKEPRAMQICPLTQMIEKSLRRPGTIVQAKCLLFAADGSSNLMFSTSKSLAYSTSTLCLRAKCFWMLKLYTCTEVERTPSLPLLLQEKSCCFLPCFSSSRVPIITHTGHLAPDTLVTKWEEALPPTSKPLSVTRARCPVIPPFLTVSIRGPSVRPHRLGLRPTRPPTPISDGSLGSDSFARAAHNSPGN